VLFDGRRRAFDLDRVSVVIRRAKRADYDAICRLFRQGDELHARALPSEYRVASGPSRPRKYIYRLLSDATTVVLLAERGGRIAGISLAYLTQLAGGPLVRKKSAVLDSIVVDEKHRRKGVGSVLLKATEAWAKERGVVDVRLNVIDANKGALRFYAAHGYGPLYRGLIKVI
jgi:GNAT superfamily N-acetyltransferase